MKNENVTPEDDFRKHYIRLRTVIDSLESTALRYCLKGKSPKARIKRARALERIIMPAVKEIAAISEELAALGPCGDGYCLCNGVCVPYDCPEGSPEN
jgi:hypothetical protein